MPGSGLIKWPSTAKSVPQGLKPSDLCDVCGTTKVVPIYKTNYETGSSSMLGALREPAETRVDRVNRRLSARKFSMAGF